MTYAEACTYLFTLPRWADQGTAAYRPGLEKMETLMDALGRPHEAVPSLHVGGTNGKGSTASFAAAIATASGRRVGLHTSPHLVDFGERMRIDGQPAPRAWIADAVAGHRGLFDALQPSFFEASVALSFLYFAEQAVALAVVEVGLGGRLDATNVLLPEAALVTYIGLDHTAVLGDTKAAIAREKAGIAKPGVPFLTAEPDPDVRAVLRDEAEARGASFEAIRETVTLNTAPGELTSGNDGLLHLDVTTPVRRYPSLPIGLPGTHQAWNAALAVRAAEVVAARQSTLLPPAPIRGLTDAVTQGIAEVRKLSGIRGRCEVLSTSPLTVLDVAHNADGLAAALAFARARRPAGTLHVLLGLMRDKDLAAVAAVLRRFQAIVAPVTLGSPRARTADDLRAGLTGLALSPSDAPAAAPDTLRWLQQRCAPDDAVLATG
ncbi:MAG: cyanophycin synthetase, partial [Bacteroidota bacterium]